MLHVVVVMPAKNEERFLSSALDSLLLQKVRPDRIFIVLDRCTDRTPEIAYHYAKRYRNIEALNAPLSRYKGFLYKAHRIAELVNKAIRSLDEEFEYLMVANADTVYSRNYLEEAITVMRLNPDCAITGWLLDGTISGSGMVYRASFLKEATNGFIKECANEELYMQLKALSLGYKIIPLRRVKVKLLRPTGRDLRGALTDGVRDGYASYTLGFTFPYILSRVVAGILSKKILQALALPSGYFYAALTQAERLDVACSHVPLIWQNLKIRKNLGKYLKRKRYFIRKSSLYNGVCPTGFIYEG